jgi:hypothetical protein
MASTSFFNCEERMELVGLWEKRNEENQRARYQRYADLLLENFVWPKILKNKASILEELKENCRTATHPSELSVPIWSFNNVQTLPPSWKRLGSSSHYYALQSKDKDALLTQWIYENGWNQVMKLENEGILELPIASFYPIIQKSNFLEELGARFGAEFRVVMRTSQLFTETHSSGEKLYRDEKTLYLQYFPRGLPEPFQKLREAHLKSELTRSKKVLKEEDMLVIQDELGSLKYEYGPFCICCYSHDYEEGYGYDSQ